MDGAVSAQRRLRVHHAIAFLNVLNRAAHFADDTGRLGAQSARHRRRRIEAAANIGIDVVNADRFVFHLDFVLARRSGGKFHRFEYVRATMLVKFNTCCHASSRMW
ncbi:Uncharacterised protein [Enterobacter cloacae]|nr:Uncharacterised protein [Enterobacter cloacae]